MALWDQFGQGMLNAGLGYWQANQGVDAANANAAAVGNADAQRRAAYSTYGNQLMGMLPAMQAGTALKPATATTGFATSNIDPATGRVGYNLNTGAQGMLDKLMGGARSSLDMAGDFNPETMAAKRLAAQQALLAPRRAAEDASTLRKLQAKGLVGMQSAEHGGSNPFTNATQAARAQADSQAAYDSLTEGEKYLDRLLGRSGGMLKQAQSVDESGAKALSTAGDWTNRFTNAQAGQANATGALMKDAFKAQRDAAYDQTAMDKLLAAQAGAGNATAMRNAEAIRGGAGMLSGLGSLGGIFDKIGNLFSGSGGFSGDTSFDVPMFNDYGSMWGDADYFGGADFSYGF
jgi:hypothetical protein